MAFLVLVSFGYTSLPFWPQGKNYHAYFADAGGIIPGNDVTVSGIRVGKVKSVSLAGASAKVDFTIDRKVRVGDQSLAAIRTDTVLGEKAVSVTPAGAGSVAVIPLERTRAPTRSTMRFRTSAATPVNWTSRASKRPCRCSPTRCARRRRSCVARWTG